MTILNSIPEVLELTRLIEHYCISYGKAVLYYEINCLEERRDDVVAFYNGKIDPLLLAPLKTDDDNFITFDSDDDAIQYAEMNFPYESECDTAENFIHCRVWSKTGSFAWENTDGNIRNLPQAQPPTR